MANIDIFYNLYKDGQETVILPVEYSYKKEWHHENNQYKDDAEDER